MSFNAEYFLNKHKQIWKYSYHRHRGTYFTHSILVLVILLTGIQLDRSAHFPTGTLIGIAYFVYVFYMWLIFFSRKKKYFQTVANYSERYQQKQLKYTYSFSDFGIGYEDNDQSYKITWSLLKPVVDFQNVLLIISKDTNHVLFSISKKEINDLEYSNLFELLKEKTGLVDQSPI
jgi:hypothetical protein